MAAPVRRNPPSVPAREGIQRRQLRERLSAPAREQTRLCAADPIAKNAPSRWAAHGAITASLAAVGNATRNRDPRQSRDPTGSEVSMKYRGIEYSVVQGTGRHIWKWSVAFDADHSEAGRAATKAEAISGAERAIDRALAPTRWD